MGMYTEFVMAAKIENNPDVIQILDYMLNDGQKPVVIPKHKFFSIKGWQYILNIDSYYFPGETHSSFIKDDLHGTLDEPLYYLTVRCNLKNYNDEIEEFIDWLLWYIVDPMHDGFIGYMRYEEDEDPQLLYIQNNRLVKRYVQKGR